MNKIRDILICKISDKWLQILWSEFLASGSVTANIWGVNKDDQCIREEVKGLEPGALVVLVNEKQDHSYIVGGGFYFSTSSFKPMEAWYLFGVRNGVENLYEFNAEIYKNGGSDESNIVCNTIDSLFLFNKENSFILPDEYKEKFKGEKRFYHLSAQNPLAMYLNKFVLLRRHSFLNQFGERWNGVYKAASERNELEYYPSFKSRVFSAYNYTCALTNTNSTPTLKAFHIQPFYDFSFQGAQNGILLRADICELFSHGYITAYYADRDHIKVKVSEGSKVAWSDDYLGYDGKDLKLPNDRTLWPKREYLQWHQNSCFEHWLHVGGSRIG